MSDNVHVSQFIDFVFRDNPFRSHQFLGIRNEHDQEITTGSWIPSASAGEPWRLRLKVKPGLNALGRLAATIRAGAGFEQPVKANLSEKLMLAVSELSEALEEHRDGKPLRYYQYKRDQRHVGVDVPDQTYTNDGATYEKQVERDRTEWAEDWIRRGGKAEALRESGLYQRDGRWYVMDTEVLPFNIDEWSEKGAFDKKPEGVLVEIADCVIRCFDMMQGLIDEATDNGEVVPSIEDVIMEKMNYNATRGNNKHGRNF